MPLWRAPQSLEFGGRCKLLHKLEFLLVLKQLANFLFEACILLHSSLVHRVKVFSVSPVDLVLVTVTNA